ncbi:hypothetical protein FQA47_018252 [Oryzias melastigma]|uniref:Uncharacterized protein n=1 Tax=Oryzias melastigma TaxID=30732 RepID=A0A834FSV3_ORYME|nr:hypothetical protein FQA47_018252 [Oryzias melastigma]
MIQACRVTTAGKTETGAGLKLIQTWSQSGFNLDSKLSKPGIKSGSMIHRGGADEEPAFRRSDCEELAPEPAGGSADAALQVQTQMQTQTQMDGTRRGFDGNTERKLVLPPENRRIVGDSVMRFMLSERN